MSRTNKSYLMKITNKTSRYILSRMMKGSVRLLSLMQTQNASGQLGEREAKTTSKTLTAIYSSKRWTSDWQNKAFLKRWPKKDGLAPTSKTDNSLTRAFTKKASRRSSQNKLQHMSTRIHSVSEMTSRQEISYLQGLRRTYPCLSNTQRSWRRCFKL